MKITLLGTGTPRFDLERAGPSQLLDLEGQKILIDCGPLTTYRLFASSIAPSEIETLFFTHHHLDHNADFPILYHATWLMGRKRMKIRGPIGTKDFVSAILKIYDYDFHEREHVMGRDGLTNPEVLELESGRTYDMDNFRVSTLETLHRPLNLAYRFAQGHKIAVFTGDTAYQEQLARFAEGANVLVHEIHMAKPARLSPAQEQNRYLRALAKWPLDTRAADTLASIHSTPQEAARVAQKAGVKTLVFNHILPLRDLDNIKREASALFSGNIVVGEDLMTIEVD